MDKKMFGYSIRECCDLMVGVVMARDIEEAKSVIMKSFHLDEVNDEDFEEIKFDDTGICEIYYGG